MSQPVGSVPGVSRNASHVEMQPDAVHDGAAGGGLESQLPVSGNFSTPMTLGGYSASPNRPEQLTSSQQGMNVGSLPPTGMRR